MITNDSRAPLAYQVPYRCREVTLERLQPAVAQFVTKGVEQLGALLYGPTGVGKSFAMFAAKRLSDGKFDDCPMWVDWPEFIGDVDRWKVLHVDDHLKFDPMRRLCEWRGPLFVDDVGQEHKVDSGYRKGESEALFDQFVNRRTGVDLALWITSNLSPKEIRQRYGERTFSRLSEHCLMVPMGGDDRRLAAV